MAQMPFHPVQKLRDVLVLRLRHMRQPTAGTINGRFAINAKAGERQTPTGIDAINAGGDINSDKPFKFIYHDKVYIWINGVIYDTTGKRVK